MCTGARHLPAEWSEDSLTVADGSGKGGVVECVFFYFWKCKSINYCRMDKLFFFFENDSIL